MKQAVYSSYPVINNRYHVIEPLGSGGMASVYLAYDEVLDRDVALKVLSHRFVNDEEFVERFRREARIAAALSHPNIAPVHDLGETHNGSYYMAMEYVPGGTLRDRIRKGPLAPGTAIAIALQVAQALRVAHAHGTIHRDVKPQNILLTEAGVAKVVDFGIAQAAAFSEITQEGHVLGTEHYMSPEQARGGPVGPGSDLYSLGIVLYEMLTGKLPHKAYGPLLGSATLAKRLSGYPPPPKGINPLVPEALSAITLRLLMEEPKRRYPDAASLIADLEKAGKESFGSAATRILSAAFQGGKTLGSATTKVLGPAVRQARTSYKIKTRKTKPYVPPAPVLRRHRTGKGKPMRRQRKKISPRSLLLVVLTLAAVLASLNPMSPGAKARLPGEVERGFGDGLRETEYDLEQGLENWLQGIESKLDEALRGIITPSSSPQQGSESPPSSPKDTGGSSSQSQDDLPSNKQPDRGSQRPNSPPQNGPSIPQNPSGPYAPPPRSPSYPSNSPEGSFSPGVLNPSPSDPPNNSNGSSGGLFSPGTYNPSPSSPCNCNGTPHQGAYQQSRDEVERQIDESLNNLRKEFGQ